MKHRVRKKHTMHTEVSSPIVAACSLSTLVRRDVIIAEPAHHVGVTNIAEKHWSAVPGFEPRTSRKPGDCSTDWATHDRCLFATKLCMSERACSLHISCVSESRYKVFNSFIIICYHIWRRRMLCTQLDIYQSLFLCSSIADFWVIFI